MRRAFAGLLLSLLMLVAPGVAAAQSELSVTDGTKYKLMDRRYVAAGDRAYVMGFQDGNFYAQGWHISGEMGGVWSQPLKLIDGLWFNVDGQQVGQATKFTSGWGYVKMDLPSTAGLTLSRTDFAPDGVRGGLIGLRMANSGAARTVTVKVDTRSEVLHHYPWTWTKPNAVDFNAQDTGSFSDDALEFHDPGNATSGQHDWVALVGSDRKASAGEVGPGHWGAQEPREPCTADTQQFCDDGPAGKGLGGQLTYQVAVPANGAATLWIAAAGSEKGTGAARAELAKALKDPAGSLAAKRASRERASRWTRVSLPGDQRLAQGIDWGKQNILDLTQRADDLQIRKVDEGNNYPPPIGTVAHAHWIGAGYPDYPWIFSTDAEYTAFASVTVGQFEAIEDHARAVRDVSELLNGNSGKVAHEIVGEGSVYYGDLDDKGNTDETAKFPSLVALIWRWTGDNGFRDEMYGFAKRNLNYIYTALDADDDGWPEGLGNVERTGMGDEKLDNTVYTIRGLYDLADMAQSKHDNATYRWARDKARDLRSRFESAWWMPRYQQYADSLRDPGDEQVQQKHWIGATPMESELTVEGRPWPGLALLSHGDAALQERETPCYSGERVDPDGGSTNYNRGMFHTACGGGPEGKGERTIFTLNTSIQAVGEGNYGRLGADQQKRYTDANVESMFSEPYTGDTPDEQPGAMPEILPSPDFDAGAGPRDANVDRCTRCRSMVMQAWGNYGTMWPVVHQQLGVRPDMGRGVLEVVPQVPPYENRIAGRNIRLGSGAAKLVRARHDGNRYVTVVNTGSAPVKQLLIGHTLPRGSRVAAVYLDGKHRNAKSRETNRGVEVTVKTRAGRHRLVVMAG
jgi:hypothetical protein